MILKSLHIISFGGLTNREIELSDGVNVICGENESGKSSAAMFIKFIFYGLSSKPNKSAGASERQRYVNRDTSQAAGYIIAESSDGTIWRIERLLIVSDSSPVRERVRIINKNTGEIVTGQNPGEYFFSVPEDVFVGTCFVSQTADIKPNISGLNRAGTGGAVENLLTSADENVDIKHAIEIIDSTRRAICHKNGTGGTLTSLRKTKETLSAEKNAASQKAAEIISISTSLDDIKKRISELEETGERTNGILSALEKINLKKKIDSSSQTREKLDKLTAALSSLDASPFGIGFEEALLESERDIRAYDEECAAFDDLLYSDSGEDKPVPEETEILDKAYQLDSSARIRLSAAFALMITGILGLAASFVLYFFNTEMYLLPLIMTIILVVVGVVLIIMHAKVKSELSSLLDEWDAESISDLELTLDENLGAIDRNRMSAEEKERLASSLDAAKLRFDAASDRIKSLAAQSGITESNDIYETISALHKVSEGVNEKRRQISSKIENLKGRLSALDEQLDGVNLSAADLDAYTESESEYGKIALSLDAEGVKNLLREKEFTDSALKSAVKRKSALEEKLVEIGKLTHTPDEYSTMIASLDERIDELTLRCDACELALEALSKAGESMRSGVIPKIAAKASSIIEAGTPHDRITLDSAFNCSLGSGDDIIPPSLLSRGTADLTYIALRIALADEVFRGETPAMIFDESFAHVDMNRLEKTMRMLDETENGQYIIFTCRNDEADCASSLGIGVTEL